VCGQNTNITAENMPERVLSLFVYVGATLFFAYIIAVVTDQLSAYVNDPTNKAMDELDIFCRFYTIPNAPQRGKNGQMQRASNLSSRRITTTTSPLDRWSTKRRFCGL
jgi:hypothetical protein